MLDGLRMRLSTPPLNASSPRRLTVAPAFKFTPERLDPYDRRTGPPGPDPKDQVWPPSAVR